MFIEAPIIIEIMFYKINEDCVRNTEGFTVQLTNIGKQQYVKYSEGDLEVVMEIEGGTDDNGDFNWVIYSETLKKLSLSNKKEMISPEKREEIIKIIEEGLKFLNVDYTLV